MKPFLLCFFIFCPFLNEANPYPYRFEGIFEEYDGKRLELIAQFIPDSPVVFEAGGHYGEDTVRLANMWPEGTIVTFEPNPAAFEKLQDTISELTNVHAYLLAAGDKAGVLPFYVCYGSSGDNPIFEGASSLLEPSNWMKANYQGPVIEVECVLLDDWCEAQGIDHIDFMWLDMEGMEQQTLSSSPKILDTVKVIYTETNFLSFRKGMTQFDELHRFLEDSGFCLLSHWYAEGFQGNAIFIKKELFPNE